MSDYETRLQMRNGDYRRLDRNPVVRQAVYSTLSDVLDQVRAQHIMPEDVRVGDRLFIRSLACVKGDVREIVVTNVSRTSYLPNWICITFEDYTYNLRHAQAILFDNGFTIRRHRSPSLGHVS